MARSVGGAVAEGIEAGFGMGLRSDEAAERKRARAFDEDRSMRADVRANEEFELRKKRDDRVERREGLRDNLDLLDRQGKMIGTRQKEITDLSTAAQTANQPVDPALADEYGKNAEELSRIRQRSLDFFSRAQTGQLNPLDSSPGDFYMNLTAATGMLPSELKQMPQHAADVQAGLDTGNPGLMVQGVNGLFAPQLRRGVGGPSPHGGTVTRKEIIGLDPAVDNDHRPLPGKFMPRLRVYVKTDGGDEKYYDAPMTTNGSGEPDDNIAVIDVAKAMNWMGNMTTLATALDNPAVQSHLEAGEKADGGKAAKYLEQLTNMSRPKKKVLSREKVDLGDRILDREIDDTGHVVSQQELKKGAPPKMFNPRTGTGGGAARGLLQTKLDALDEDLDSGDISEDEYRQGRRALLTGIKPAADKGPGARDVADDERAAVNAVADKLGMVYDANARDFRNRDGTAPTAMQKEKLGAARTAITTAARDAAAKKTRKPVSDLVAAGNGAAPPAPPKFEVGKTYRDGKGREAVYQPDGTWKVK